MPKFTLGIVSVELGNVANDGDVGTTLATLGLTNQDSAKLNQEDAESTDFFAEEVDAAVYSFSTPGNITFDMQIMNPDTATLAKLFGGTVVTGPPKSWKMPASIPVLEQTVKLTPKVGLILVIPRGLVTAKLNGEFSKKNLFVIDVTIKALEPTKSGVGRVQFIEQ